MAQPGGWIRDRRARWAAGLFVLVALGFLAAMYELGGHDDASAFVETRPPPGLAERFYPPEGWAWGLLRLGSGPVQRYGVVGAEGPRANVLILPDYGDSAETWFETARDLAAHGETVWVLEGVGQGGSQRLTRRRDLGEVTSFDRDAESVRAMIDTVVRPRSETPLVILGEGQGAWVAARAVETGAVAAGIVLSDPRCQPAQGRDVLRSVGLGALRAPGSSPWRRNEPDDHAAGRTSDPWRGELRKAWQVANPDLRMGGPSRNWRAAATRLQDDTRREIGRIRLPALLIVPDDPTCEPLPAGASRLALPGAGPAFELDDDAHRRPWLEAIETFIAAHAWQPIPPARQITRRNAPFQSSRASVASLSHKRKRGQGR